MSLGISSILAIFLFTYIGSGRESVYTVLHAAVNIVVIGLFHIFLISRASANPRFFFNRKRRLLRYCLTYVVTVFYSFIVSPLRDFFADPDWRMISTHQKIITILVGGILLDTVIISVHNLVIMYRLNATAELENEQLKAANAESQTLLLQQQIHPHFLFNALSMLKTLYHQNVKEGDTYIIHLSGFLRAAISNTAEKLVTVSQELSLCNDYISMQQIRFGNALHYSIDPLLLNDSDSMIPSFALQPLLENAIKHNEITERKPLHIRVFKQEDYIIVSNNLQLKTQPVLSTGKGLNNLNKRYELLFGEIPRVEKSSDTFAVFLKVWPR